MKAGLPVGFTLRKLDTSQEVILVTSHFQEERILSNGIRLRGQKVQFGLPVTIMTFLPQKSAYLIAHPRSRISSSWWSAAKASW